MHVYKTNRLLNPSTACFVQPKWETTLLWYLSPAVPGKYKSGSYILMFIVTLNLDINWQYESPLCNQCYLSIVGFCPLKYPRGNKTNLNKTNSHLPPWNKFWYTELPWLYSFLPQTHCHDGISKEQVILQDNDHICYFLECSAQNLVRSHLWITKSKQLKIIVMIQRSKHYTICIFTHKYVLLIKKYISLKCKWGARATSSFGEMSVEQYFYTNVFCTPTCIWGMENKMLCVGFYFFFLWNLTKKNQQGNFLLHPFHSTYQADCHVIHYSSPCTIPSPAYFSLRSQVPPWEETALPGIDTCNKTASHQQWVKSLSRSLLMACVIRQNWTITSTYTPAVQKSLSFQ